MVKILNPLGGIEARGKLGGTSYNTWRGISYARTITTPLTQYSERQVLIRGYTHTCINAWSELTEAQRQAWNIYANTHLEHDTMGSIKRLSGYNWFVRCGVRLLDMGESLQSLPPIAPIQASIKLLTPTFFFGGELWFIEQTWTHTLLDPGAIYHVDGRLTKPLSAGRTPKLQDAVHNDWSALELDTIFLGPVTNGHYGIFLRLIRLDNGLASNYYSSEINVEIPE